MRASLIVACHNEGTALGKTLESCIESAGNLDYEIVVADDASTDGSAENVERRFPQARIHRHNQRRGASPTKAMGARHARGEVLLFLDGHCLPEGNALVRLVEDVERVRGEVVTPQIAALDTNRWRNALNQVGNGYHFDLLTFQCSWQRLDQMRAVFESGWKFYESAALIGCAFAVGRALYDRLWGFDPHMSFYGVEDLDFALKCWLMGHRVLHDPSAVIGHKFQNQFERYAVPAEHVVVNELRAARKNFSSSVWDDWVEQRRMRSLGPLAEHPEGLWARAWSLFEEGRPSAEQERSYLQSRRTRDEFWYAERFGLAWPRLESIQRAGQIRYSLPSPSPGPSPSPAPCNLTGIEASNVQLYIGEPGMFIAKGSNVSGVQWSTTPAGNPATGSGANFKTRWSATGTVTVTATCGSTTKTFSVRIVAIEVQINNTAATNDDLVALKCDFPPQRFNVNCQARLLGPAAVAGNVVLTNPDGRLRFPNPANTTVALTLAANGAFSAFQISGESASAALGDAVIQLHEDSATGFVITQKSVTVFSFDQAKITLNQGGNYAIVNLPTGPSYTVNPGNAVTFSSIARIRPAGINCTAPQVANLNIGIMQESSNFSSQQVWDTPTMNWLPATASGTAVDVALSMSQNTVYAPAVVQPVADTETTVAPLYDQPNKPDTLDPNSLQRPIGCQAGGASANATSFDTPSDPAPPTFSLPIQVAGVTVGNAVWGHLVKVVRKEHFRTFCVLFNTNTQQFCAFRQATWDLNVDSSALNQHAVVNADGAAAATPATGVSANHAPTAVTTTPVGAGTQHFVKP